MTNLPQQQASAELALFDRSRSDDIAQGSFRFFFFDMREHVLGKSATVRMTFEECATWAVMKVREDFPGFVPRLAP